MRKTVEIAGRKVGDGQPVFIVVELGVCHEQSTEVAKDFVRRAKAAGADAVKVEAFQADELVTDKTVTHTYGTSDGVVTENYYELLKRLELNYDQLAEIKREADEQGIIFFPTVATNQAIDFFEDLGVVAYKLASPDLIHYPLQRRLAQVGKPVFLDTGGGFIHEVEQAVLNFAEAGHDDIIIMHNPSGYPAPPEKTDLRMIQTMRSVFDIPIGLSCHTPGLDMVMAAIALGAAVIEKPITRDQTQRSPEHVFSFPHTQANEVIRRIRDLELALGKARRTSVDPNSLPRFVGRRGLYAAKNLQSGDILDENSILLLKPERGVSVKYIDMVLGRRLKAPVAKGEPIDWDAI